MSNSNPLALSILDRDVPSPATKMQVASTPLRSQSASGKGNACKLGAVPAPSKMSGVSFRRSPRFSSSATPQPRIGSERSTRRSPRLGNLIVATVSQQSTDSKTRKREESGPRGRGIQTDKLFQEKLQRRSPRLVGSVDRISTSRSRENRHKGNKRPSDDTMVVRRSPRFTRNGGLAMELPLVQSKRRKVRGLPVKEEGAKELTIVCLHEKNQIGSECPQKGLSDPGIGLALPKGKAHCIHNVGPDSVSVGPSYPEISALVNSETEQFLLPRQHIDMEKACTSSVNASASVLDGSNSSISLEFVSLTGNGGGNEKLGSLTTRLLDGKPFCTSPKLILQSNKAEGIGTVSSLLGQSNSLGEPFSERVELRETSHLEIFHEKSLALSSCSCDSALVDRCKIECSAVNFPQSFDELLVKNNSDEQISLDRMKHLSAKREEKRQEGAALIGEPILSDEAQQRWNWRYEMQRKRSRDGKSKQDEDDEDQIIWNVKCHYAQAEVNGSVFDIGDCANIRGEGGQMHIGRIVEFFRSTDEEDYFRVQWFYKAEDTVIKEEAASHDSKRVFYSNVMNDNPIDCIVSKVNILKISNTIGLKRQLSQKFDFYFDMEYCVDYSTFRALQSDSSFSKGHDLPGPRLLDALAATNGVSASSSNISVRSASQNGSCKKELVLLDLFSGCGGMSTGLCIGAALSGVHLVVRWALDSNKSACESLKLNHPETQVRSEAAEDFLALLKEWEKLCKRFMVTVPKPSRSKRSTASLVEDSNNDTLNEADIDIVPGEFEVSRIVDICFGDPKSTGNHGLKLKVHWKGYSENEDSWEPIESLSNCQECIRDFVRNGVKSKILPVPGDVDVICGGPPCQGISGYNRFRNVVSPLDDERNRQIAVFMDIVQFLKPKFVLMENVVDILRFDKASLARYALSRLVQMKYQARLGTVAAGCYGLPQFRLRVFLWGAHASEKLPQFPLPTHDVIVRYWPPPEFERNTVAYDEEQPRPLERAIILQDAISDLPAVTSHETREQMPYDKAPETEFQVFIRAPKSEMIGHPKGRGGITKDVLHDHRTYTLTDEDYARVCHIPKRKGANFRDLPGIVVGADNVTRRDPKVDQILLPSGKPLVPDFALTFSQGKSRRPYGRLWWDETVPTVVTYPDLHSQAVLHPDQDRVLTIRECARLQGFPDYYRFCGTVKARYRQIGNAVAVPVGRALGYAMGMAALGLSDDEPLMCLPKKFSHSTNLQLQEQQLETVGNPTFE